jgi:4-hydroxybenzoate polyprenyltransferase
MKRSVAFRLGRVSNLPTVWTNVLAGAVLSGAALVPRSLTVLLIALSLFYVAGMYLNDAFDRKFDAAAYPQRPIPSGSVTAPTVFTIGFLGLTTGELLLIALGYGPETGPGWPPVVAGLGLAGTIIYYNVHHKQNPLGPVVMGLCRAQVYLTTALALAPTLPATLWWGAGLLMAYTIGLSYLARQETLTEPTDLWPLAFLAAPFVYGASGSLRGAMPALVYVVFLAWVGQALRRFIARPQPDIRGGVSLLIAAIPLLDALLIALAGGTWLAAVAVGGALLTRLAHRMIPGT